MRKRAVLYLLTNDRCSVRCLVSLYTLRKHYDGDVVICHTPQSTLHGRIAEALQADTHAVPLADTTKHQAWCTKTTLPGQQLADECVYLDSDTIVQNRIDGLWPSFHRVPLVVTSFGGWKVNQPIMRGRVQQWDDGIFGWHVRQAFERNVHAVNGGVIAWNSDWDWQAWNTATCTNSERHLCDEVCLNLLYPHQPSVVVDDRFNWSPQYGVSKCPVVVHFHGRRHCRPESRGMWLDAYNEVVGADIGGVRSWTPAGDKRLRKWLSSRSVGSAPNPPNGNPSSCATHAENE